MPQRYRKNREIFRALKIGDADSTSLVIFSFSSITLRNPADNAITTQQAIQQAEAGKAVNRILLFKDGRIVEQRTHDALIVSPASYYKKLYDMQAFDLVGKNPIILGVK